MYHLEDKMHIVCSIMYRTQQRYDAWYCHVRQKSRTKQHIMHTYSKGERILSHAKQKESCEIRFDDSLLLYLRVRNVVQMNCNEATQDLWFRLFEQRFASHNLKSNQLKIQNYKFRKYDNIRTYRKHEYEHEHEHHNETCMCFFTFLCYYW